MELFLMETVELREKRKNNVHLLYFIIWLGSYKLVLPWYFQGFFVAVVTAYLIDLFSHPVFYGLLYESFSVLLQYHPFVVNV